MNEKDANVQQSFVIESFSDPNTLKQYSDDALDLGLWESEKIFFTKYFPKAGRILDIGCGAGRTTLALHQLGYQNIIGVDLTPGMIEEARNNSGRLGIEIHFEVGDACNLAFKDASFDGCLFSFNGLMQIPVIDNRIRVFQEVKRVLVQDGIFIFTTHDREAGTD